MYQPDAVQAAQILHQMQVNNMAELQRPYAYAEQNFVWPIYPPYIYANALWPAYPSYSPQLEEQEMFNYNMVNVQDVDQTRPRQKRTKFTEEQIQELEKLFEKAIHPSQEEITELSKKQRLPEGKVKTWFQNRRAKLKKEKSADQKPE